MRRFSFVFLVAFGTLVASGFCAGIAPACATEEDRPGSIAVLELNATLPLAAAGRALRAQPRHGEVYQLDQEPIGSKKPLLLVHGGGGETRPYFRWDRVIKRLNEDSDFRARYKIFLYRYNSKQRLDPSVLELQRRLVDLQRLCENRPVTLMALSLGGNLVQGALVDRKVNEAVELVLAMGTPFHGSPLFSSDWFQYSLDRSCLLPWSRTIHALDYRIFFRRHMNYLEDLKWDNADCLIPEVGRFKSRTRIGPRGVLTVERDNNPKLARLNADDQRHKQKFIVYAGYLVNPYLMSGWRRKLETTLVAPYAFLKIRILAQFGREHPALSWLNREMSRLSVNEGALVPDPHAYKLNDGITPVSSALFLPPEVVSRFPILEEAGLDGLDDIYDVRLARAFKRMDHTSFMDGGPPGRGSNVLADEIHPEHGKRDIFDWILSDLQNAYQPVAANDSKE